MWLVSVVIMVLCLMDLSEWLSERLINDLIFQSLDASAVFPLYKLSYHWIAPIGICTTILVGIIVSYFTKDKDFDTYVFFNFIPTCLYLLQFISFLLFFYAILFWVIFSWSTFPVIVQENNRILLINFTMVLPLRASSFLLCVSFIRKKEWLQRNYP